MPILLAFIGIVAIIVIFGLIISLPLMLLWNYCLVGAVVGVNEITWLQAWGLYILCGLMFKSSATNSKD